MLRVGYVFERFPSFDQAFCYREVAELLRQGADVQIFSIRRPEAGPAERWDSAVLARVTYLPGEAELVAEIARAKLPQAVTRELKNWGRQSDFLRLHQAAWIGLRLSTNGLTRVHAHFAGMAARTAYWLRQFFDLPFSFTAHANDIFAPRQFVVSLPKLIDAAASVVTVSDFSANDLRRRFPDAAAKIHRVYNGVNVEQFQPATPEGEVPLLIGVGRLVEKKGFNDLISACGMLRDRGARFRCEIIGEGPLHAALDAQIASARLADVVQLLGPQPQREIIQRLARASVFALPCTTEASGGMDNLPTVIMEAMAAGLPIISTPIAGVPEMVQPGVTGELVPDRAPAALADAIVKLLADPDAAREMGARGRAVARERFGIEANVRALAAILQG
jgi:colanic acid/amylovoran biosynthesis glycosyltransferase